MPRKKDLRKDLLEAQGRLFALDQERVRAVEHSIQWEETADYWEREAKRLGAEIAEIKGSLNQVAVYEGLVEGSPTALLVAELVRDHDELESRIDAVVALVKGAPSFLPSERQNALIQEIGRLVQGGARIPDTLVELDE